MPRDPRALRVAVGVQADPGPATATAALARAAGASRRTMERLFRNETGMSFGRWRQQARLLQAMRLLARGDGVISTALEVGYQSPSAFIAAFSAALGITPGRYYRENAPATPQPTPPKPARANAATARETAVMRRAPEPGLRRGRQRA